MKDRRIVSIREQKRIGRELANLEHALFLTERAWAADQELHCASLESRTWRNGLEKFRVAHPEIKMREPT